MNCCEHAVVQVEHEKAKMRKYENAKTRRDDKFNFVESLCFRIFAFFPKKKQIYDRCNATILCRPFAFLPRKCKESKTQRYDKVKLCRVLAYSHCCILRQKSENTTWRKSATITYALLRMTTLFNAFTWKQCYSW